MAINFHGNFRLALDDVEIRDEITVRVDEKSGAETFRRADLHDGLADLLDELTHVPRRGGEQVGVIKLLRGADAGDGIRDAKAAGGRIGLGNAGNGTARHDKHRVANIHDDGIRFLGENLAGDGGLVLELDGVGGREIRGA